MSWSLKISLFISNVVILLRLVMAYEVFPLLIQSGSFSIAYFRAFLIEECFGVGSWGGTIDKLGEGA